MKKPGLKLEGKEMLTKEQMKKISGGVVCTASIQCSDGSRMFNNVDCADQGYGYGSPNNICASYFPGTYAIGCSCPPDV